MNNGFEFAWVSRQWGRTEHGFSKKIPWILKCVNVGAYPHRRERTWNSYSCACVARTTIYGLCFNLEVSRMCIFGWPF